MSKYEYKVVPAPQRSQSVRGAKRPEDKFAQTLALLMNELGADGWDYVRADTLPVEERRGLTSRVTVYHNLLVFRRVIDVAMPQAEATALPEAAPAGPAPVTPAPAEAADGPAPQPAPAPVPFIGPRLAADRLKPSVGARAPVLAASRTPAPATGEGLRTDHAAE